MDYEGVDGAGRIGDEEANDNRKSRDFSRRAVPRKLNIKTYLYPESPGPASIPSGTGTRKYSPQT
jgi:hypothetical protein